MTGSRVVARNVLASLVTQAISWLLTFIVTLYLPRYVGATGLGKLAFAGSFVSIFAVMVPLGTSSVLVREIARDRERTAELLSAAIAVRVVTGLLATCGAILLIRAMGYPAITRSLVVASSLGMMVIALNDAIGSAMQGHENIPRQSIAIIIEKCLSSTISIVLVIMKAPLWSLASVTLFSGAVSLMVNLSTIKLMMAKWLWPTKQAIKYIVTAGLPFVGYLVCRTLYGQTDPVVLNLVTNDKTVGWYAAAFRLVGSTMIIPVALTSAVLPTLSRLHLDSAEQFNALARKLLAMIVICGVPITAIFIGAPDRLIALLHYPHDFIGSIPVLQVDGLAVFMFYLGCVLGTVVVSSDGQSKMMRASFVACFLGIPACFAGSYITHKLWANGAIGAAFSDVLLEIYLVWAYIQMLPAHTFGTESIKLFFKAVAACVPMGILMYFTRHSNAVFGAIAAGLPLYLIACWQLKCLDMQYLLSMREMFSRRSKA